MPALRWQWVMIGLDTNVVLRWLTADDSNPAQNQAALRAVDAADDMIFLNDIVIAECCWVLATRFRLSRPDQAAGFRRLLAHPMVRVSNLSAFIDALTAYEMGGPGLSDRLIGALNHAAGCKTTLTFDKAASKGPHFSELT